MELYRVTRDMKKVLLAVLLMAFVLPSAQALAQANRTALQTVVSRTEVCVNASDEAEARRLFPNASFHVFPDLPQRGMNGWRVMATSNPNNMTDAEERAVRVREFARRGYTNE